MFCCVVIFCATSHTWGINKADFALHVTTDNPIVNGIPARINLTIKYNGNQRVGFVCEAPYHVMMKIDAPEGWTRNSKFGIGTDIGFPAPVVKLNKSGTHTVTLYLQDYFTKMPDGAAELAVTLMIMPVEVDETGKPLVDLETGPQPPLIELTNTVKVQVREATEAEMGQRITLITKKLEKAKTEEELTEIYHGLALVPDARLMPLYLRGLSNDGRGANPNLRWELQRAICRSVTSEPAAAQLSQWLGTSGGRLDEELVRTFVESKHRTWRNEGPLVHAESLWIKLYVIKYYKEIDQGRINGLKAELNELQAQLDKIISERESAKQSPSP